MDELYDFDLSDDEPTFDRERLAVEWSTLNAIREMLGIALKGSMMPTYQQSIEFAKAISPSLFDSKDSLLGKSRETQLVEEYRQKTQALSQKDDREVPPTEIIDRDIKELRDLIQVKSENDLMRKKLGVLEKTRSKLLPKKYTENQLILHDLFKVKRKIPIPPIEGDTFREFQLTEDRGLRIRLLHPDQPEQVLGADLIYETYWDKRELLRLAVVQYKIWNRRTLYTSQANNLEAQLDKLKKVFCDGGLCQPPEESRRKDAYRLPFCAAFLRPTDKIQSPNSHFISSGLHVPICVVRRSWEETGRGGKKIESKNIRSESLSHQVFEEVFNTNMLGSRWLTYSEVEELYKKHKILDESEKVILHAQEFSI